MVDIIFELLRYVLTLFFGISISALFLAIDLTRRNIAVLSVFTGIELLIQGSLYLTHNVAIISMLYPAITHLPLLILFMFAFKKRFSASLLAITIAYLCCQIANWFSAVPSALEWHIWTTDIVYILVICLTFILVIRYVLESFSSLLAKPTKELYSFGIVPVFYYIFDYISTVYTELLYAGHVVAIEFTPFLMSVCYMLFCTAYFKQYEEKMEAENRNRFMSMKQKQSDKEINMIKRSEQNISLLRHDMRHFLSTISAHIENNELDMAQEYIKSLIENVDNTAVKKYCTNEIVNMILSSYENDIESNNIDFKYTLKISKDLPISDVDLTSILSNGFENAVHAALQQEKGPRIIELEMIEKSGKLLISLENTYGIEPIFLEGIPITENQGHGLGTQSILHTAEKLKGNCKFSAKGNRFILQVIL